MNAAITRQWYGPVLVAGEDGVDAIEPGVWMAVLVHDGQRHDGSDLLIEYRAGAGASEITGMETAEIRALLLDRVRLSRHHDRAVQIVHHGPRADLGVADLTGPVTEEELAA